MPDGRDLRWILGQIRCVLECIDCLRRAQPLPLPLCYVPHEAHYKVYRSRSRVAPTRTLLSVWETPSYSQGNLSRATIELSKRSSIKATGQEYCSDPGLWVKLTKEQMAEYGLDGKMAAGWVLLWRKDEGEDRLVPAESAEQSSTQRQIFGVDSKPLSRWEDVVDSAYIMRLGRGASVSPADEEAVHKLRFVPPSWSYECDEELARFLCERLRSEDDSLGGMAHIVDGITVSSFVGDNNVNCLTDGREDTMWEGNKEEGALWIRLDMKEGAIISNLLLTTRSSDDEYLPKKVLVFGGKRNALEKLNEVIIDRTVTGDTCVLSNMTSYLQTVEIRIAELHGDGAYVWVRGIKAEGVNSRGMRPAADMFAAHNLVRFPVLEAVEPDVLYWRAAVLLRFVKLLDNVLCHLISTWDDRINTFSQLKHIKQLLLLSEHRLPLITQYLRDSESADPEHMPQVYINRRLAAEHRENPALDPTYKKTMFSQVYEGLKLDKNALKPLNYRWSPTRNQWWTCEFIAEGMRDCGGGFRDSMSDISEELCPSSADCPVPLPFFVRTSNQGHGIGESRDMYVPNPSCKDLAKYRWIGQLMGAAMRGQDFLVLALPALVWKQLIGEEVRWSKDFPAVDSLLVKLLEMMEVMDKETFEFKFGGELMYTVVLSDQRMVELVPGGSNICVRYEDRLEFIRMVKKVRLEESKEQVEAIQSGLLTVVPQAVLELLTWQEVEKKVCGDPEIAVEALKKLIRHENMKPTDTCMQYFWEALNNFTNEDRSRLLRFITGRSRLPTPVCILADTYVAIDSFPTSSTCSQTLHLPNYSSAKVCEEKLRYAAYNCVAIDTDHIWDD